MSTKLITKEEARKRATDSDVIINYINGQIIDACSRGQLSCVISPSITITRSIWDLVTTNGYNICAMYKYNTHEYHITYDWDRFSKLDHFENYTIKWNKE